MSTIVILGAGVMGSALACVAATRNNVLLVGSPLDKHIISCLKNAQPHPKLGIDLPPQISAMDCDELDPAVMASADVIVLGVSSPGVTWALQEIKRHKAAPGILALVTKGLVSTADHQSAPLTYAQTIPADITSPPGRLVGIGGPCIALELALGYPTQVSFAAENANVANEFRELLKTDYYFIATHSDITALEACAALKNFMCIGVSAMSTLYKLKDSHAKNPVAALFNQAVREIALLSRWIKQDATENTEHTTGNTTATESEPVLTLDPAYDLAGLGDLHVTVGGGRNSKLGQYLGTGRALNDILQTDMLDVTVEGVDTARQLLPAFNNACRAGRLNKLDFPLTQAILDVVEHDQPFVFDFGALPVLPITKSI